MHTIIKRNEITNPAVTRNINLGMPNKTSQHDGGGENPNHLCDEI